MTKRNLITEISRIFPSVSRASTEDDSNQFEAFANTLGTFAKRWRNVRRLLRESLTNFPKSLSARLLVIRLSSSNSWRHWNCYFSAVSQDWAVFLNGTKERNLYKSLSSKLITAFSFSSLRIARIILQSLTRWRENVSLVFPSRIATPPQEGALPH